MMFRIYNCSKITLILENMVSYSHMFLSEAFPSVTSPFKNTYLLMYIIITLYNLLMILYKINFFLIRYVILVLFFINIITNYIVIGEFQMQYWDTVTRLEKTGSQICSVQYSSGFLENYKKYI